MQTHEQIILANPDLVYRNAAAMRLERDGYYEKFERSRSPASRSQWLSKFKWAQRMLERYDDDIRIIENAAQQ
jgi:hypothetical protein